MPTATSRPVTVELDSSSSDLAALDAAAVTAENRDTTLVIVHVWGGPFRHPSRTGALPMPRVEAERLLYRAAQRVRTRHPDLDVHTELVLGSRPTDQQRYEVTGAVRPMWLGDRSTTVR